YPHQHSAARLGQCNVCHEPHSSDQRGLLAAANTSELCFRCHANDAANRKWVHKPLAEKGCQACHDAHGSDYLFNLIDGEGNTLCLKCHAGVGTKVKTRHRALDRYGCVACHTPHAGDVLKGLLKNVNDLCTSCHAAQGDGSHIGTFSGTHPVAGKRDPRRKDEELSCVSCHSPHGSDSPRLLYSGATPQESCKGCH